jgi:hypothetical protein|tara:strand:+ start:28722 stop:29297 length:576 start_codon:yes stop_codon:yes gene_type:complete
MIEAAQKRALTSFAKDVVKMAKSNLSSKKGATKLEGTIKYKLEEDKGRLVVSFLMADYGTFVDKGVKGSGGEIKTGKYKGNWGGRRYYQTWQGKRKDSPFAFGKSKGGGLTKAIGKWTKKKGIKGRDEKTGRFITDKSLVMLISRNIYIRGLHGISFLQNSLNKNIGGLRENYSIAFKEDFIETAFATTKK